MSKLSEEEILDKLRKMLFHTQQANECGLSNNDFKEDIEALEGILDLYEIEKIGNHNLQMLLDEEKEKNNELEKYANWHIEHLTEDIADYIDDDRKGNASIIGELKEEREHWKDIIRINKNEKTYIDYKNY